jgi:hypothetical protein
MAIRGYLSEDATFEPAAITAMSQALEEACTSLSITSDQKHEREQIAMRIIDLARSGMIDAKALRNRVLFEARTKA